MRKLKIIGLFTTLSILVSFYTFGQSIEIKTTKAEVETVQLEENQSSLLDHEAIDQQNDDQKSDLVKTQITSPKKSDSIKTPSKPALVSIFQEIIFYLLAYPLEYNN